MNGLIRTQILNAELDECIDMGINRTLPEHTPSGIRHRDFAETCKERTQEKNRRAKFPDEFMGNGFRFERACIDRERVLVESIRHAEERENLKQSVHIGNILYVPKDHILRGQQ